MSEETVPAFHPWNVFAGPGSPAEAAMLALTGQPPRPSPFPGAIADGIPPSPTHDLTYNGGKTIPNLVFTNLYLGGDRSWNTEDIRQIDHALAAAMTDVRLNNVMAQYFPGQSISSAALPSRVLPGAKPAFISQGDVEQLMAAMHAAGTLGAADLSRTVFNVMLPSGVVLNTDTAPTRPAAAEDAAPRAAESYGANRMAAVADEPSKKADSLNGLGGYHGSLHVPRSTGGQDTVYYAVGAYSEIMPGGTSNGIVAFDAPWKNVVATFYHELNEARTDADVEDAIRTGDIAVTGWVSAQGEECGDYPVFEADPLSLVFQEVALADGSGTVPVQFQYSNAVHGPEGPIDRPHTPIR